MSQVGLQSIGSPYLWAGFIVFVLAMLALDLGVFQRKAHAPSMKEALGWSLVWVALAVLFGVGVYIWFGAERATEFAAGYLIEKALAVDNLFVFVVVFAAFGVPPTQQHRVLFWGIIGALIMRAAFIFAGSVVLQKFHFTMYIFGALLVATGVKFFLQREETPHPERSRMMALMRRVLPMAQNNDPNRFFVREAGRLKVTSLFLALVAVEITDLVFAIDSIPAIFAVTSDPFIVFTSNILAILGLRSLFFLLAGVLDRFRYLKFGLSVVLVFIGLKMLLVDVYKVPVAASLLVIVGVLTSSILLSLWRTSRTEPVSSVP